MAAWCLAALGLLTYERGASACSGHQFERAEVLYPERGLAGVPTNVVPLFSASTLAAVGLFDASGAAVQGDILELGLTPYEMNEGEDEDGTPLLFSTSFTDTLFQFVPKEELTPLEQYDLVVVAANVPEARVLSDYPAALQEADAGALASAVIRTTWPGAAGDGKAMLYRVPFEAGDGDLTSMPPAPKATWLSHGYFEDGGSAACQGQHRVCLRDLPAGELLLAELVFESEEGNVRRTVGVARSTEYQTNSLPQDARLRAATLTTVNAVGRRSPPVELGERDLANYFVPETADVPIGLLCEQQWAESKWPFPAQGGTDRPLPDAGARPAEPMNDGGARPAEFDASAPRADGPPDAGALDSVTFVRVGGCTLSAARDTSLPWTGTWLAAAVLLASARCKGHGTGFTSTLRRSRLRDTLLRSWPR